MNVKNSIESKFDCCLKKKNKINSNKDLELDRLVFECLLKYYCRSSLFDASQRNYRIFYEYTERKKETVGHSIIVSYDNKKNQSIYCHSTQSLYEIPYWFQKRKKVMSFVRIVTSDMKDIERNSFLLNKFLKNEIDLKAVKPIAMKC